jgi:hypothetical protein
MKKVLLLVALAFGISSSYAQLSTRENDVWVEKFGARPVKGDMALTFAIGTNKDSSTAGLYSGNLLRAGDLLTFKKYLEDDMAFRLGVRLYKQSGKSVGTSLDSSALNVVSPQTTFENEIKRNSREFVIVPGVEKHFNAGNIFDVYTGADLYLGFKKDRSIDNKTTNTTPNKTVSNTTMTTKNSIVGLGWIVGFNIFVAQLPISVGLEYGLNAKWNIGGKTKVETEQTVGDKTESIEYFTQEKDAAGAQDNAKYKELKKSNFGMDTNQNVRLAINIYFGK